jgi:hypothetical protein
MPCPSHSSGGKVQPHLFSISAIDAEYKEVIERITDKEIKNKRRRNDK